MGGLPSMRWAHLQAELRPALHCAGAEAAPKGRGRGLQQGPAEDGSAAPAGAGRARGRGRGRGDRGRGRFCCSEGPTTATPGVSCLRLLLHAATLLASAPRGLCASATSTCPSGCPQSHLAMCDPCGGVQASAICAQCLGHLRTHSCPCTNPESPHFRPFLVTSIVRACRRPWPRAGRPGSPGGERQGRRGGHSEGPRGRGRGRPSSAATQGAAAAAARALQQEPSQPGGQKEGWETPPGIPVHGARSLVDTNGSIQASALLSCRGQIQLPWTRGVLDLREDTQPGCPGALYSFCCFGWSYQALCLLRC